MASVQQLRDRLRRPLEQELRSGCRDDVVVGGIEKLLATVGRPFADVQAVMDGELDPFIEAFLKKFGAQSAA